MKMSKQPSLRTRIRRCGGIGNFIRFYLQNNFELFWRLVRNLPVISGITNSLLLTTLLNSDITKKIPRIPRHNLKHDYATMDLMYDESRTTYGRVLPRDPVYTNTLPSVDAVATIFLRDEFIPEPNRKVNLLLAFYAQWFSHQFFNTNPDSPTQSNQPVGLNLSQLYGSTKEIEDRQRAFKDGLFKSIIKNGEEFPEIVDAKTIGHHFNEGEVFNIPIPLANLVPGFAAVHVLFFRHHQYVARELKKANNEKGIVMTDEELYQKAKLIVLASMLKMTMEDYVSKTLQSSHTKIRFDLQAKERRLYKLLGPKKFPPINAIQTEFNFLYRWHQFYPDTVKILKKVPYATTTKHWNPVVDIEKSDYDCDLLQFSAPKEKLSEEWNSVYWLTKQEDGLERLLLSAASQRAGMLTLMNTNSWLVEHVIKPSIKKARQYELASYNDYREYFGFTRLSKFEEITDNPKLVERLKSVYRTVDDIEYYVGIFAEEKEFEGIHGPLLATIGVGFTFTGIFASRLFETDMINEQSLTKRGMELIDNFTMMKDFVAAHTKLKNAPIEFTMSS